MKKFALTLISAAALVIGVGGAANAQYGAGGTATAAPANPGAGESFMMTLNGCQPGENVNFALVVNPTYDTATSICGDDGTASAELTLGTDEGTHVATATGETSGVTASLTFVVPGATPPTTTTPPADGGATTPGAGDGTTGSLPATGSDGLGGTTQIALGLLVVGLGLFGVAQLRRRQTIIA